MELSSFVDPVHLALMRSGGADPVQAVMVARAAIEAAREVFRDEGLPALVDLWERKGDEADRVLMSVLYHDLAAPAVSMQVTEDDHGQPQIWWPARLWNGIGPVEDDVVTGLAGSLYSIEELGPSPGYWDRRIEAQAAAYVLAKELTTPYQPAARNHRWPAPQKAQVILFGTAKQFGLSPQEQTRRLAVQLTSPDNPDRMRYRMLQVRETETENYPKALLTDLAESLPISESTIRRHLIRSRFRLPADLAVALVPTRPDPSNRDDSDSP